MKVVLTREPLNALRWSDLAREYTVLAQSAQATSAIHVALRLAPGNRFVLRCAATLYVQVNEEDRAVRLLETAPSLKVDPWVLAPYVAISDLADHKSQHHHDAVRLSRTVTSEGMTWPSSQRRSVQQRSTREAAGGVVSYYGRVLRIRPRTHSPRSSGCQPDSAIVLSTPLRQTFARDFEARARRAAYDGLWDDSVVSSSQWLADQPFSADAACFGSFSAWVAEDWVEAYRFATCGLLSNPGNPVLLTTRPLLRWNPVSS